MGAEDDNHCKTYNHCATYCERRDGLITQVCRRRTAQAPHVPLGNLDSSAGVSDLDCAKVRLNLKVLGCIKVHFVFFVHYDH